MNTHVDLQVPDFDRERIDFDSWRRRLELFDPEGRLDTLMAPLTELLEDHYERFYWAQVRICQRDPKLAQLLNDEFAAANQASGVDQNCKRFKPPLSSEWVQYINDFGRLMVAMGSSMHVAMGALACVYGEASKVAMERLDGQPLRDALRALHLLHSIEGDILVSAMQDALRERHVGALKQQAKAFESSVLASVGELSSVAGSLRKRSEMAVESSESLKQSSAEVATAAQQSATAMEDAGKSVEQLSRTITSVSGTARQTSDSTSRVSAKAAEAAAIVSQLSASRSEIDAVLGLIRDIAEQTQILALNASIEAARAGRSGAGFAVVASEVKHLANRTREATGEISAQIDEMKQAIAESEKATGEISSEMSAIERGADLVQSEVERQEELIRVIVDAISETFLSAEHVSQNVSSMKEVALGVAERFGTVGSDFDQVEEQLAKLDVETRDYGASFQGLVSAS